MGGRTGSWSGACRDVEEGMERKRGLEARASEWKEHFTLHCHAMAHPNCMLGRKKIEWRVGTLSIQCL